MRKMLLVFLAASIIMVGGVGAAALDESSVPSSWLLNWMKVWLGQGAWDINEANINILHANEAHIINQTVTNINTTGNITANFYCNATNCYTVSQLLGGNITYEGGGGGGGNTTEEILAAINGSHVALSLLKINNITSPDADIGINSNVNLMGKNLYTSGNARVDGGMSAGVVPSSSYGLYVSNRDRGVSTTKSMSSSATGYGIYNQGIIAGGGTVNANYYGVYNTMSANIAAGGGSMYGIYTNFGGNVAAGSQNLYGEYIGFSAVGAGYPVYGININANLATVTDPSVFKSAIYINWGAAGTDASNRKWALYNAGTTAASSKMFLGTDSVKTYWGTGYDASIYYDGTNITINPKEAGSGVVKIPGSLTSTETVKAEQLTSTDDATVTDKLTAGAVNIFGTSSDTYGLIPLYIGGTGDSYGRMLQILKTNFDLSGANTQYPLEVQARASTGGNKGMYALDFDVRYTGTQAQTGTFTGGYGQIYHTGTGSTSDSTGFAVSVIKATDANAGTLRGYQSRGYIANGNTGTVSGYYGFWDTGADAEDGTITSAANFYGAAHQKDAGGSMSYAYGIKLEKQTVGSSANIGILLAGDSTMVNDNNAGSGIVFGTGWDAGIGYDGTDLAVNTKFTGTGTIKINGVAAWSGTFTNGDGATVTVTDGLITSVV